MHLRLADAVGDALERIGEGSALEPGRIGDHVGNRRAGELELVERQHDVGQQDAFALPGDYLLSVSDRHALGGRKRLRTAGDEGAAGLAGLAREAAAPSGPQCFELR